MESDATITSQGAPWVAPLPTTVVAMSTITERQFFAPESQQQSDVDAEVNQTSRFRTAVVAGVNAVKAAAVFAELSPINEMIRYGTLAATLTQTRDPYLAAAVLGGSTMLVEGGAALAVAGWVAEDRVAQAIDRIDQRLEKYPRTQRFLSPKRVIGERPNVSKLAEAGVALTLGTVAAMELRQRQDSARTAEQNRIHGLATAAWMSGVLAVEGVLIAEGVTNIDSPYVWGLGALMLGVAGAKAGINKFKNFITGKREGKE